MSGSGGIARRLCTTVPRCSVRLVAAVWKAMQAAQKSSVGAVRRAFSRLTRKAHQGAAAAAVAAGPPPARDEGEGATTQSKRSTGTRPRRSSERTSGSGAAEDAAEGAAEGAAVDRERSE